MAVVWGEAVPLVLAFAMAPAAMPGGVIALELVLACWVAGRQRTMSAPPTVWLWARTWWVEWALNLVVFAWRQPFAWRRWPDTAKRQGHRAAIVFVHGYLCNRGFWLPWLKHCRAHGRPYVTVNLEPAFAGIDAYVQAIEFAVRQAEQATGGPVFLVGHSMGGLAIRAWLASQTNAGAGRVRGVVTLGAPHAGTWLARWSRTPNGRQMRCASEWLAQLCQRERDCLGDAAYSGFLCWVSPTDNVVFPAETATLPGADNRWVAAAGHIELAYLPEVMSTSLAWIASAERSPAARTAS